MKKLKVLSALACTFALCFALVGSFAGCKAAPTKTNYEGTWDLKYSESIEGQNNTLGQVYNEDTMNSFRASNLDIYMNLEDSGVALLNIIGSITNGSWELDGNAVKLTWKEPGAYNPESGTNEETKSATAKMEGDMLVMEKDAVKWYFTKGEAKDPYAIEESSVVKEDGMSVIMTEGGAINNPVEIANDDIIELKIDGKGVDGVGDPGYNLQIKNKTTDVVNISLPEKAKVGNKEVTVYMYITLNPGRSTTTFMQFDNEQMESKSADSLQDVSGKIQVSNAENGEVLGTYDFAID